MALYFLESSALVKRYVLEAGTAWVRSLALPGTGDDLYIVQITAVETVAAIALRARRGNTSPAGAAAAIADFRRDYARDYFTLPATPSVIAAAMDLAERHGLRGYDAVQLAAALQVQSEVAANGLSGIALISADTALNAAVAEGLTVDDQNAHP